jgi:hypothetical protein
LLSCFPFLFNFPLFVCLLCFFLPFFLPPVKRTVNLVIFFSNFQGFTLVPWQKVGRIWLGSAQNEPIIYQILFFPLPVFERYDTKAKISYFTSLIWCGITIIFHSGSSKRNFWCNEHSCSSKIVKVSNFSPVFTGFLLSFFPCIRTIWHRIQETWKNTYFHAFTY